MDQVRDTLQHNIDAAIEIDTAQALDEQRRDIQPFLLGVYSKITHHEITRTEIMLGLVGFFIGAISTYASYPLAADALALFSQAVGLGDGFATLLEIAFGVIAFALTAILVALPSQAEFKIFASYLLDEPLVPVTTERRHQRRITRVLAELLGPFTSLPFVGLIWNSLYAVPFLNYFVPITAIISSHCACLSVEKELLSDYFIRTAPPNALRSELIAALDLALVNINAKDERRFRSFYAGLRQFQDADGHDQQALGVLIKIFAEADPINNEQTHAAVIVEAGGHYHKLVLDIVVIVIGFISVLVYFEPAYDMAKIIFLLFGLNPGLALEAMSLTVATISTLANSIFDAMYAKYDSDYIYAAYRQGQRVPSRQALIAHVGALLSSLPSMYLAFAESQNTLETTTAVPVLIGSTLARALTFNALIDMVKNIRLGKNSLQVMHLEIDGMIKLLRRALLELPTEYLEPLKSLVIAREMQGLRAHSIFTPANDERVTLEVIAEEAEQAKLAIA